MLQRQAFMVLNRAAQEIKHLHMLWATCRQLTEPHRVAVRVSGLESDDYLLAGLHAVGIGAVKPRDAVGCRWGADL